MNDDRDNKQDNDPIWLRTLKDEDSCFGAFIILVVMIVAGIIMAVVKIISDLLSA